MQREYILLSLIGCLILAIIGSGCTGTNSWTAKDWTEQGNRFAEEGLYQDAVDAYNHSLSLDQSDPKVWTWHGIALQHLGMPTGAMIDFDKALILNPNESIAWQGKASSYIDTEQYYQALKAAEQSIQYAGPDVKIENGWLLKGFAENRIERYEDALSSFDKAIEIDPKRIDLWQHKAYTLTKLGRFVEVLKCYEVMTEIDPNDPEIWNKKGEIHLALGQINEANEAFSMAKNLIKRS